jgi:hypothetical protein
VAPNYAAKNNRQGCKKAFNKENQELNRGASPALPKPNGSMSQAGYKHSLRAFNKHNTNSLKRKERPDSFSFFP